MNKEPYSDSIINDNKGQLQKHIFFKDSLQFKRLQNTLNFPKL